MLGQILRDVYAAIRRTKRAKAAPLAVAASDNPLRAYFYGNPGRGACKWDHYFDVYHRHLARFRDKSPVVVEIGVAMGGSLPMWRAYFGEGAQIVGIDIDPACSQFAEPDIDVLIGDQCDSAFLASVRGRYPRIDVLIDDGGHRMEQQLATFEQLYPHLDEHGVYICEDTHTSLWENFGGGYRLPHTFIEHAKDLVDKLHAWHSRDPRLTVDAFTRTTLGVNFYDSIVVIEKRPISPPRQFLTQGSERPHSEETPVRFRP